MRILNVVFSDHLAHTVGIILVTGVSKMIILVRFKKK